MLKDIRSKAEEVAKQAEKAEKVLALVLDGNASEDDLQRELEKVILLTVQMNAEAGKVDAIKDRIVIEEHRTKIVRDLGFSDYVNPRR